jgi:hypothetical protein
MFGQPLDLLLTPWNGQVSLSSHKELVPAEAVHANYREMLSMAAQRARRFTLEAAQSNLTSESIDQLHDDVTVLVVAYPQRPITEIIGQLVETQDVIFTLLEGRQPPAYTRQMFLLAGVTSGLLSKASHDLADPHAALAQSRTAFLCADNVDHDGMRAWIRGLQSLITYYAGRYNESVRYARQGTQYVTRSTTSVWLPVSEARAWAALGNASEARTAIQRAEAAWEELQPDELDQLGGICTFSRPRQLYYAADALAWLPSEAEAAERYSLDAVASYQDTAAPEWAFGDAAGSASDLAITRVIRGEVEGASEALQPVLQLPAEQRINGIINSTRRVHTALTTHAPRSAAATELQQQIEAFARTPVNALAR